MMVCPGAVCARLSAKTLSRAAKTILTKAVERLVQLYDATGNVAEGESLAQRVGGAHAA